MLLDIVLQNWLLFAICAAGLTVFEVTLNTDRSIRSRVRGIAFGMIYLFAYAVAVVVTSNILTALDIQPLISIEAADGWLRWLILPLLIIAALFVGDVGFYICHRLQHAIPFLWRFHAVHHAIEELNAVNCYHHWNEGFVRSVLTTVPMTFLIEWQIPEMPIAALIGVFWGDMDHLKANMTFGPLGRIFVSPRFHRVHHSRDPRHFDKNFAGLFSIFDVVFGTAIFPAAAEEITTGLDEKGEARTATQFLVGLRDRHEAP